MERKRCIPGHSLVLYNFLLPRTFPVGVGDGEENQNNSFHGVLFYKIQQMTHNLMSIIMMSFVFLLIYNRILMS